MSDERIERLREAVVKMDQGLAEDLAREALASGAPALDLLGRALIPAMETVGSLFGDGTYFLPEMLCAVDAYNRCFALIEPELKEGDFEPRGRVLLGTVEKDIHDIGKNILAALLQGNGFEVMDLGTDVAPAVFLEKALEYRPHVIGLSALLTTTMMEMKNTVELFRRSGERDRFRIIVGGAPVTEAFAREIGADGYGDEAQIGVELVRRFTA